MKSDTNVVERLRHSVEPSIRLKVPSP
jgi:hypothetical protein